MDYNTEKNIMNNKNIESNAKQALSQYKLEIASELNNFSSDEFSAPYVGGLATRNLVKMGEEEELRQYSPKK